MLAMCGFRWKERERGVTGEVLMRVCCIVRVCCPSGEGIAHLFSGFDTIGVMLFRERFSVLIGK
jgi:hypothetical protein